MYADGQAVREVASCESVTAVEAVDDDYERHHRQRDDGEENSTTKIAETATATSARALCAESAYAQARRRAHDEEQDDERQDVARGGGEFVFEQLFSASKHLPNRGVEAHAAPAAELPRGRP